MSSPKAEEPSEKGESGVRSNEIVESDDDIDMKLERQVRLKCDLTVMATTFIIFMLTFLDRVNIVSSIETIRHL